MRVMRQLLTESLLLAFAGGAIRIVAGPLGRSFMTRLLPQDFPRRR